MPHRRRPEGTPQGGEFAPDTKAEGGGTDALSAAPDETTECDGCGKQIESRLLAQGKCPDCVAVDVHNYRAWHDGRMKQRDYDRAEPASTDPPAVDPNQVGSAELDAGNVPLTRNMRTLLRDHGYGAEFHNGLTPAEEELTDHRVNPFPESQEAAHDSWNTDFARTLEERASEPPPKITPSDRDHRTLTDDWRGAFVNGYTPEDVNALDEALEDVEIACVWEHQDRFGFSGDSEILMRENGTTHWMVPSDKFYDLLDGSLQKRQDDTNLDALSYGDPYIEHDLEEAPVVSGANMALSFHEPATGG